MRKLGCHLPPPMDLCLWFPPVLFDRHVVPHLESPVGPSAGIVAQIVPSGDNPYALAYGYHHTQVWSPSRSVAVALDRWLARGGEVTTYHPLGEPDLLIGQGRGYSRFLCGQGLSLYIVEELGPVPNGYMVGGRMCVGMYAVYGVTASGPAGYRSRHPLSFHVIPGWLIGDPTYPGIPRGLPPSIAHALVGYPPEFLLGPESVEFPGYRFAQVRVRLSDEEFFADGEEDSEGRLIRGISYYRMRGMLLREVWPVPLAL